MINEIKRAMTVIAEEPHRPFGSFSVARDELNDNAPEYIQHLLDEREKFVKLTASVNRHCKDQGNYPLGHDDGPEEEIDILYLELCEETRKEIKG